MDDYIKRSDTMRRFTYEQGDKIREIDDEKFPTTITFRDAKRLIREIPAADVTPVVYGRWVVVEPEYLHCSVCGEAMYTGCNSTKEAVLLKDHWKRFCPNCGAKMDKED